MAILSIQDNNGDGESDNFNLNSVEITGVRSSASIVSGVEIDPPSQIEKGNIVQTIKVDEFEKQKIEPYLNLGNVRVALDVNSGILYIGQELKGLLPINKTLNSKYWTFIDVDLNSRTGANDTQLRSLGAP